MLYSWSDIKDNRVSDAVNTDQELNAVIVQLIDSAEDAPVAESFGASEDELLAAIWPKVRSYFGWADTDAPATLDDLGDTVIDCTDSACYLFLRK